VGVELPEAATVIAPPPYLSIVSHGRHRRGEHPAARRATRVPPIAAVREVRRMPQSKFAPHAFKAGLGVVALAWPPSRPPVFGGFSVGAGAGLLGVGVLLLFAAWRLLAPRLVVPLARFVVAGAQTPWRPRVNWPEPTRSVTGAHGLDRGPR